MLVTSLGFNKLEPCVFNLNAVFVNIYFFLRERILCFKPIFIRMKCSSIYCLLFPLPLLLNHPLAVGPPGDTEAQHTVLKLLCKFQTYGKYQLQWEHGRFLMQSISCLDAISWEHFVAFSLLSEVDIHIIRASSWCRHHASVFHGDADPFEPLLKIPKLKNVNRRHGVQAPHSLHAALSAWV